MKKTLIIFLITILACLTLFSACEKTEGPTQNAPNLDDPTQDDDQITYTDFIITSANRELIGFKDVKNENLVIPETFRGEDGIWYKVVEINTNAFYHCMGLSSVTIPDSVRKIGSSAFYDCRTLDTIIVPDHTYIGELAFYNTGYYFRSSNWEDNILYFNNKLMYAKKPSGEFKIKDGTTAIIGGALSNCDKITSIIIPSSVTIIGESAFSGCTGITELVIPETVTYLGSAAFYGCTALEKVNIPSGITVISDQLFYNCKNLKSITIPSGVTALGRGAFAHCESLTSIDIPENVESIAPSCFSGCVGLTSFTAPKKVEAFNDHLLSGCTGITEITIPSAVTKIGNWTFANCTALEKVKFEGEVTSIGTQAFWKCSAMKEMSLPNSLTSIGYEAFCDCTALESIKIGEEVTSIANGAFKNTAYLNDEANWEDGALYIGNYLIGANTTLAGTYVIKEGTTTIASNAFRYCADLTRIVLTNDVRNIGVGALLSGANLTELIVAKGNPVFHSEGSCVIETESKTLIAACKTSVIPEDGSVTRIGDYAFYGINIKALVIPSVITEIGEYAFESSSLTSITIPSSVTRIGNHAFRYCSDLYDITFDGTIAQWEKIDLYILSDVMMNLRFFNIICTDGTVRKS